MLGRLQPALLTLTIAAAGLLGACGKDIMSLRSGADASESDDSLELRKKANANAANAENAVLKQPGIIRKNSETKLFGQKIDLKNEDKNIRALTAKLGVPASTPINAKPVTITPTSELALAGTKTTDTFSVAEFCAQAYPTDPVAQEACIDKYDDYLTGDGWVFSWDPSLPAVRSAYFPLTIPGYGAGMCLYVRVSVLAVGLACYGTSVDGTGGVWAGCDVWNGCGSGYL